MNKVKTLSIALTFIFALFLGNVNAQTDMAGVTIIDLTQIEGAFETEGLRLAPGKYQFKINNKNVDKEVGFVIQKAEDKDADFMKTGIKESFAQSLIKKGDTQYSGVVTLAEGEYVYSCPINLTPKYSITVK